MERQTSTFEYLCRVCAANTKGKNSVAECVYILKTPALRDKIEKYLYLTISEDDILPKVLCKACYRQVEATASLSKIAKHTQKVFRDFIFNSKPQAESTNRCNETHNTSAAVNNTNLTPASQAFSKEKEKSPVNSAESTPPPSLPSSACSHKDDVVVNVSVTDPLTRETQHKIINATQWRTNSLDSRFTPKSIAQRGLSSSTTPKQQDNAVVLKKQSPPGVINFLHAKPPQQVTTITSGGYVIGCVASTLPAVNVSESSTNTLHQKRKNLKMALNNIKVTNSGQVSLLKTSQKPSQHQMTDVAAQSSVLQQQPQPQSQLQPQAKVQSQSHSQPQSHSPPQSQSQPQTHSHPQSQHKSRSKSKTQPNPLLLTDDEVQAEPLPDKMIIAGTKQKRHNITPRLSSETEQEPTDLSHTAKSCLPDDILLGKVIKDIDLLKLILKALKWPVTKQTMEPQIARLRNSKFAHIMSDPNLLQDPDLSQIMGPYLGPVLQAAQMLQQQQQIAAAAAAAAATKAAEFHVAGIANAIPYKLPAETSVQLVPASPEEDDAIKQSESQQSLKRDVEKESRSRSHRHHMPPKKIRRVALRARSSSLFIPDEYEVDAVGDTHSTHPNSKSTPNFHVDIDPSALFSQLAMISNTDACSSNDALLALLQRQKSALTRQQRSLRRKRSDSNIITVPASSTELAFDGDDIILMEPDQGIPITPILSQNNVESPIASTSSISLSAPNSSFPVPQQISKPLITRPIIKRRKTVIQASPACTNLAIKVNQATDVAATATITKIAPALSQLPIIALEEKPSKSVSTISNVSSQHAIATQYPSTIISIGTQVPSANTSEVALTQSVITKATETIVTATASASTSIGSMTSQKRAHRSPVRSQSKKQLSNKSTLGQQLLEAIGLQKIKDSEKEGDTAPVDLHTRGSVQQIRSALKKSLQKAQERQKQNKQEVPVAHIDLVDDNVSVVKEVVVGPKPHKSGDGQLDVEEEINKITLVLQSKVKEDRKLEEVDKKITAAAASRIPGIRRKVVPLNSSRKTVMGSKSSEKDLSARTEELKSENVECKSKKKDDTNFERDTPNEKEREKISPKSDKEDKDTPHAYSAASTVTNTQHTNTVTGNDENVRKRVRKPKLEEKKDDAEMQANKDDDARDKDKDKDGGAKDAEKEHVRATSARSRLTTNARKAAQEREYEKESDTASLKGDTTETIITPVVNTRPTRVSKTMSRYYKGPDSRASIRNTTIATRSSKNRN